MAVASRNNFRRGGMNRSSNSGFGRMLLLSFGLHLLIFLIFGTSSFFSPEIPPRQVYHVDLLSPPAKPKPTPVVKKPAPAQPKAAKKPPKPVVKKAAPKPKPKAKKPTVKRAKPKKVQPAPVNVPKVPARPTERDLSGVADRIAALKKQKAEDDIANIKDRLAQIKAGLTAPVAPETTGQASGAEIADKIQAYLTENWTLSPYQLKGNEVDALYRVEFNALGEMIDWKLLAGSGSAIFDQSAKGAILKSKKLPFPLDKTQEFEILFEVETIKKRR